jgi:hypothetical protein
MGKSQNKWVGTDGQVYSFFWVRSQILKRRSPNGKDEEKRHRSITETIIRGFYSDSINLLDPLELCLL